MAKKDTKNVENGLKKIFAYFYCLKIWIPMFLEFHLFSTNFFLISLNIYNFLEVIFLGSHRDGSLGPGECLDRIS